MIAWYNNFRVIQNIVENRVDLSADTSTVFVSGGDTDQAFFLRVRRPSASGERDAPRYRFMAASKFGENGSAV